MTKDSAMRGEVQVRMASQSGQHGQKLDGSTLRRAMSNLPTGVSLVIQGFGVTTEALTIGSLVSVSLDPPLLMVSIRSSSRMRNRIRTGRSFAVNILAESQVDLSVLFASAQRPRGIAAARRLRATSGITGNALVHGCVALECELYAEYVAGDHVLLLGQVVAIHQPADSSPPLVFHLSRYGGLR